MTRHRHTWEGRTGSGQAPRTDRRGFLRGASAAVVGAVGLTALPGSVAATDAPADYPRISTRDHFDDDAELINGETAESYDREGDWSALGDDTLALFVHGWRASESDALDGAYEAQQALEENGYDGDVAAYSWDADEGDSIDLGWTDAKEIAERNGQKLANAVTDWNDDEGTDVRLIAHSLGARVTVATMESLEADFDAEDAITSATLLGGAIEEDDPSLDAGWWDEEYGDHIEFACEQFDNFYNDDDPVLEYVYETREFEDAVGEKGIDGPAPDNYTDFDVTDTVDGHGDYYKRDVGCMDQVVDAF